MSSSATPEERAQFAELEICKERCFKEDALPGVNAACERVKTHYAEHDADAYINLNGDVSPGESVGSAQVVSSQLRQLRQPYQLKEAIDTIMKECTGDWIDKFDCDGAKSVPRCVLVLCCSACISA